MEDTQSIAWQKPTIEYVDDSGFSNSGITESDPLKGTINIKIATAGYSKMSQQLVLQHELLHVEHDLPKTIAEMKAIAKWEVENSIALDTANGIADAANHLLYWPKGESVEVDAAQVRESFRDLETIESRISAPGDWDDFSTQNKRLNEDIVLRGLATLRHLGTPEQLQDFSKRALVAFTASEMHELSAILDLIAAGDKQGATLRFSALHPLPQDDEILSIKEWLNIGFRGEQRKQVAAKQLSNIIAEGGLADLLKR